MYGYVYKITCDKNNKQYIGQHKSSEFDPNYLGSGTIQQRAVKKYGKEYFSIEVLCVCETADELDKAEQRYITEHNAVESDDFYNLINYGESCKFSESTRSKMSESAKIRSATPEFKIRMSNLHKGKVIPPKVIEKRVATLKANNILYNRSRKGYKLSPESIQKMVESRKGYTHSEETKNKISESLKIAFRNRDQFGTNNPFYGGHHTEDTKKALREYNLGKIIVNNGEYAKQISKEELDSYLSKGFVKGPMPLKYKRRWIHNSDVSKLVSEEEFESYIKSGWIAGRK